MKKTPYIAALMLAGGALVLVGCSKSESSQASVAERPAASSLTVTVVQPQTQKWIQTLQANGPIQAWQEIIVSPETSGLRIAELRAEVGAVVKRGDLLARLADDGVRAELRKQQAAVAQAKASLAQAKSNNQRAQAAAGSGALSDQQIDEYRINEQVAQATFDSAAAELDNIELKLSYTRIVAVDDGVVASRTGVLGNVTASGSELYRLIRQGRLEWQPELDSKQLMSVRTGQTVRLTLSGGQMAEGKVRLVGPVLDANTGRAKVYVTLSPNKDIRSGMFSSGTIIVGAETAMTLPQSAVVLRDGRAYVWLLDKDNKVSSRVVTTGRREGERVEVIDGVKPGARVVSSGGSFLAEGATVIVVSTSSSGSEKEISQ